MVASTNIPNSCHNQKFGSSELQTNLPNFWVDINFRFCCVTKCIFVENAPIMPDFALCFCLPIFKNNNGKISLSLFHVPFAVTGHLKIVMCGQTLYLKLGVYCLQYDHLHPVGRVTCSCNCI